MNEKKRSQLAQIRTLASAHQVEILAHFFQRAEVKLAADFVGGGLELVKRAAASPAKGVMVCGASFMTTEIERLRPGIKLLTPRQDLSCPLAEAVTPEEVLAAKQKWPQALVVVDMKVSPTIRALADVEISPPKAAAILSGLAGRQIIALPGAQVADWAGFSHLVIHRWPQAVCRVHELAQLEDLAAAQAQHPQALCAAHLLCLPEVKERADFVGDSAAIKEFCAQSSAQEFIIISEAGLAEYLTELWPGRAFYETEAEIFCANMKLTSLKAMIASLENFPNQTGPE